MILDLGGALTKSGDSAVFFNGLYIGIAQLLDNFQAMRFIRHVNSRKYETVVAALLIIVSLFLMVTV